MLYLVVSPGCCLSIQTHREVVGEVSNCRDLGMRQSWRKQRVPLDLPLEEKRRVSTHDTTHFGLSFGPNLSTEVDTTSGLWLSGPARSVSIDRFLLVLPFELDEYSLG